jgi:hypothetical protein
MNHIKQMNNLQNSDLDAGFTYESHYQLILPVSFIAYFPFKNMQDICVSFH